MLDDSLVLMSIIIQQEQMTTWIEHFHILVQLNRKQFLSSRTASLYRTADASLILPISIECL
jgi:hypothetical protein